MNAITDPSELLEPLEDDASAASGSAKSQRKSGKKKKGMTVKPASPKPASNQPGKQQTGTKKKAKDVLVQMSHEWIEENLDKAVGVIASDIRRVGYSRHLFYCPAYHPSGSLAAHMKAKLNELPASDHLDHKGFHYPESDVRVAVNRRKSSLRKKHGALVSLRNES